MKESTALVLEHLKIGIPVISSPKFNFLEHQTSLKYLDFSDNDFRMLHREVLGNKSKLETLILAYNRFTSLPNHINGSKSLIYLDISFNNFTILESIELPNLKVFKIDNNPFKKVHDNSLDFPNLNEFICFNNHRITTIFGMINSLKTTKTLKAISVSHPCENRFELNENILQNLENMTVFTRCWNNQSFMPSTLNRSSKLKHLEIIPEWNSYPNPKRREEYFVFDITSNFISKYFNYDFENNSQLEVLLLSQWKGPSTNFNHLSSLRTLKISTSFFDDYLTRNVFFRNQNLVDIVIENTNLYRIEKETFESCLKLKSIRLTECNITEVSGEAFSQNELLEQLDLSHNDIRTLPPGIFDRLENLKSLSIGSNLIQSLPEGMFKNQNSLKELELAYMHLDSFDT